MPLRVLAQQIRTRPRLLFSAAFGVLALFLVPSGMVDEAVTRALVAWNAGICLYIVLVAVMIMRSSEDTLPTRAQLEDEGQHVVLGLVVIAVIASLVAIAGELAVAKDLRGSAKAIHVALAALTVISSWAFMHLIFALHYAHNYYAAVANKRPAGLEFPGKDKPDYGDFFYFSAIIGTSAQTADVSLVTSRMRRLGSLHCIVSFFFNTIVLALTINIAASIL